MGKNKKKITEHYLHFPMFRSGCHVVVCKDIQYANQKLKLVDDDLSDTAGYTNTQFINGWALMVLTPKATIDEITHEANHFLNAMFKKMGYKTSTKNDEVQSYLIGWICSQLEKYIKKHKKKKTNSV